MPENYWNDIRLYEKILLKWIWRKLDIRVWTGLIWLGMNAGGGFLQKWQCWP